MSSHPSPLPALGIRLHGGQTAASALAMARAADAARFAALWFADNPFARGTLPLAAACATATHRVQIGAGVFNPFSRHPTLMAMEIAALDEISLGRATLSIGSGIATAMRRLGLDADTPLGALRDTLTIVRGLLRGEQVRHRGDCFTADDVRLDVAPRPGIGVFLAARGPLTVALAGELADGLIVSNMCTADYAQGAAARVQAARAAAGRPGLARIVQYLPCAVGPDPAEAAMRARRAVGAMLPGYWALGGNVASARASLLAGGAITEAEFATAAARIAAGEDRADALDDRFAAAFTLFGPPEQCLAQAARYAAMGVSDLALTFSGPAALDEICALGAVMNAHPPPPGGSAGGS